MALSLFNVEVNIQDFGTRYAFFLTGKKEEIEGCYYAFYNHGATSGEIEWSSDTFGFFWVFGDAKETARKKLEKAMVSISLDELIQAGGTKGSSPLNKARQIAQDRVNTLLASLVYWYMSPNVWEAYALGDGVKAEKGTGNFDDDTLAGTLERSGANNAWQQRMGMKDEEAGEEKEEKPPLDADEDIW